ncbi:MAG: hypothetical protein ACOWWM_09600 [Desulfobacterales bacterium]
MAPKSEETQICTDPACSHNGDPQPIDAFRVMGRQRQRISVCKECLIRRQREGKKNKPKEKPQKKTKAPAAKVQMEPAAPVPVEDVHVIELDMSENPKTYQRIAEIAAVEFRTAEAQIRKWISDGIQSHELVNKGREFWA